MVNSLPGNSGRPAAGSLIDRWLARHAVHPDSFECGVLVVSGSVIGEGPRWQYRRSALDRLVLGGVVTINHGITTVLRLRFERVEVINDRSPGRRPGFLVRAATEQGTGARLLIGLDSLGAERLELLIGS